MKKIFTLVLALTAIFSACNNESEVLDKVVSGKVSFVTKVDRPVTVSSRAQADIDESGTASISKFVFYAFRQYESESNGNSFILEKIIKDDLNTSGTVTNGGTWTTNNESSLLPVGKYKFISLYNLGNAGANSGLLNELVVGTTTYEDAKVSLINHTDDANDVNEIFCGIKDDVTNIGSGNEAVVTVELKRLVARIDVKFIKVAADNSAIEIPYHDGNTIFGISPLTVDEAQLQLNGIPTGFSFDKTVNNGNVFDCLYSALLPKLTVGNAANAEYKSTYPDFVNSSNFDANSSVIQDGIIKGGAYLKGAYVLPFILGSAERMQSIVLTLTPSDTNNFSTRTITVDNSTFLQLQPNHVTVITVKLVSTTNSTTPDLGTDEEHLFNPKTKLVVTIDTAWGGSFDVPVEVH